MNPKISVQLRVRAIALAGMVCCLGSAASAQWNEQVLYSFQNGTDGATPTGAVVFDKAENLYGVTQNGGSSTCLSPYDCGTVYKLTPPTQTDGEWTETVLYVFKGYTYGDGASPQGGLVIDDAGNLYGTTGYGGTGPCLLLGGPVGCGTVYELSPPAQTGDPWTETVLYSFQGGNDGFIAFGDVAFDKSGNLYGATLFGGGKGTTCDSLYGGQCGTVFELSPPKINSGHWTEKVLHRFAGPALGAQYGDGALPNGGLVLDSAGVVYGTTYYGGNNVPGRCEGGSEGTGCGIVFALVPPIEKGGQWREKVLHMFNGTDGANSAAGVVFDASGNLYGTTFFGPPHGNGLVFELKKPSGNARSWTEAVLYLFADGPDGEEPNAALTFDASGNLYGTAYQGSYSSQYGDVFRLKPPGTNGGEWTFSVLYGFHPPNTNPGQPASKLTINRNDLYGTTQYGGTGTDCNFGGCGTVFAVGR